jgi:hypothetical protein
VDCRREKRIARTRTPEFLARQAARAAQKQETLDLRKQGLKLCGRNLKKSYGCQQVLLLTDFAMNRAKTDNREVICRTCEQRRKQHLIDEKPYWYEYLRWKNNWKKYTVIDRATGEQRSMTVDDWCQMWTEQDGLCAMCHSTGEWHDRFKMSPLYVDHSHDTGLVRALTCGTCNTAIGHAKDDSATLRRMADYLEQFEQAA